LGFPEEVFNNLNPKIEYWANALSPMFNSWDSLKNEICPSVGTPGRPFIFMARSISTGIYHTHVVKGFYRDIDEVGVQNLFIDDHWPLGAGEVGPRHIDYECKYKLPPSCQTMWNWQRAGDFYNLHKAGSPSPPPPPCIAVKVVFNDGTGCKS